MTNFFVLLTAMADNEQQKIDHLPLMDEQERKQILCNFNTTNKALPQQALIHQLVEQQVTHKPDAIALMYENHQLSYAELNRQANQLAHALVEFGVCPD
ncbi:AMP-binding protein, partial [Xenorhabdus bovienii]|uniref:AMP-binding protein n=1 Tax=Xenorhabdus bovienii TaxID=40576 RepID=UPI0023B34452